MLLPAFFGNSISSYDAISATWSTITISFPSVTGENSNKTIEFDVGSSRTLKINYNSVGTVYYSKNDAAYIALLSNGTFSVADGDTVKFQYQNFEMKNESKTVSVTDVTRNAFISTFSIVYTGAP